MNSNAIFVGTQLMANKNRCDYKFRILNSIHEKELQEIGGHIAMPSSLCAVYWGVLGYIETHLCINYALQTNAKMAHIWPDDLKSHSHTLIIMIDAVAA